MGGVPGDESTLAHSNERMTCYACHTSWTTSCFGCHLPMSANRKLPMLHNEGLTTRNYTAYNFEVLRDDIYMLGVDGTVTKHRIAPTRSTCAVVVSSQNANRDWIYYMQQTVSAEGFSGFGFSPYYPHTVRATETKMCTDCHVSRQGDNNAWMAQLLMQGTNLVNFMGRYVYVAEGSKGFDAVPIAEHDDPPAVFGSDLQKLVYSKDYQEIAERHHGNLHEADHHPGNVLDVQLRGEYLYAALGKDGFRVYDVANIDNKDFSEKMVTAPVSPLGQRFYVKTKNATAVGLAIHAGYRSAAHAHPCQRRAAHRPDVRFPLRDRFRRRADRNRRSEFEEQSARRFDAAGRQSLQQLLEEGCDIQSERSVAWRAANHHGRHLRVYLVRSRFGGGQYRESARTQSGVGNRSAGFGRPARHRGAIPLCVCSRSRRIESPGCHFSRASACRFRRYPPARDARNIYVARTYAYIAGGKQGLVIVDVERPEHPRVDQVFTANGVLSDTRDVKLGMTAASAFAYVADGKNGLRIVQLFAPNDQPNYLGFSPKPTPKLIATYHTSGPALAVSKGIDRDRAVDEDGNQIAVFNRRGSRPFNHEEAQRLYLKNGRLFTVTNAPPGPPVAGP